MRVRTHAYTLLVLVLALCCVAGCGGVARIVTGVSNPGEPVTGEPEKVVARFVEAVNKGDLQAAADCWVEQSRNDAENWYKRRRITFKLLRISNEGTLVVEFGFWPSALVTGTFEYVEGDGARQKSGYGFRLVRMGEDWKILDDEPEAGKETGQ